MLNETIDLLSKRTHRWLEEHLELVDSSDNDPSVGEIILKARIKNDNIKVSGNDSRNMTVIQYNIGKTHIQKSAFAFPSMFVDMLNMVYISDDDVNELLDSDKSFYFFMLGKGKSGLRVKPDFTDESSYARSIIEVTKAYMRFKGYAVWGNPEAKPIKKRYRLNKVVGEGQLEIYRKNNNWKQISDDQFINISDTGEEVVTDVRNKELVGIRRTHVETPLAYSSGHVTAKGSTPYYSKELVYEAMEVYKNMDESDWKKWNKNITDEKHSAVLNKTTHWSSESELELDKWMEEEMV